MSSRSRVVAVSTLAASRETFTPRRVLLSTLVATPSTVLGRVTTGHRALLRTARDVIGAAAQVPALVARVATLIATAELLVSRIDDTNVRASGVVDSAATTGSAADATVAGIGQIEKRVTVLIDRCEPMFDAVTALDPATVRVFEEVITELRPLLAELHDAIPEVRGILPVVSRLEPVMVDVETRIAGLPGSARLRRRGEQVIDEIVGDAESGEQ